ncbi:TolC family protein [Thiomicrorhabdus indica]|uniref:TolC family protein n=1 Tax=Thiomicrorhabdus indica TaxID=2267253 RepID=UPI00102D8559|nr:TolC family protein [Thiomicrorhabdus indica]
MKTSPLYWRFSVITLGILSLSGCATVDMPKSVQQTNQQLTPFTQGELVFHQNLESPNFQQNFADELLKSPLNQAKAVSLLLNYSPEFQSLLAQNWSRQSMAAQIGRIHNPAFSFERVSNAHEIEIGQVLSFGLLDLLTLPARQETAKWQLKQRQAELAVKVVTQISQLRNAWIDAVVAQEKWQYAKKVMTAAEATATLAKRMQAAGNFTRIQSLRQQLFYSDAAVTLAKRQHEWLSKKEQLVRLLGLTAKQAKQLKLPSQLSDLPDSPLSVESVKNLGANRLDIQMAQIQLDSLLSTYGIEKVTSFTDIEVGLIKESKEDREPGDKENSDGFEIEIQLPIFDWGELKRQSAKAKLLQAQTQLLTSQRQASSYLRESYSAYRTAYDIAKHYQNEVVPMQEILAEENTYQYNGMFISVFQLISDSKQQISAIESTIDAKADFWKAKTNLDANLIGQPITSSLTQINSNSANNASDAH